MGRKLAIKDGGKENEKKEKSFLELIREQITEIYLFIMLVIYPLFQVNGYADLVYKKWAMFRYASLIALPVILLFGIFCRSAKDRNRRSFSVTDWFVLGYLVCAVISYVGAVDRRAALWGVDTWYTGFVSQLLFVGIYFCISRGYGKMKYLKLLCAGTAVIVGSIVILQRFGMDVLNLYQGFGDDVRINFVTTLGQVTWTSGYISILLIAGMGIYFLTEERNKRIFWGICIGIGFATEMVLNCDSGVIAVFGAVMIMVWLALGNRERTFRLIEIIIIALTAAASMGILERILTERMVLIDEIYLKAAQSGLVYLLLVAAVILRFLLEKERIHIPVKKDTVLIFKGIYIGLACLGILSIIVLFILHGKGYFAGSSSENYFHFTVWWGNSRGFIWRTGAAVFGDFGIWRRLFGCGPDCFTPYAYGLMGDAINEFWHNQIVPNVHNEWFNALINYGVVGGTAYLGIFVSAAASMLKTDRKGSAAEGMTAEEQASVFGIGLAAAGYIMHNILCYQQIIATPIIFVLMGLGTAIRRK